MFENYLKKNGFIISNEPETSEFVTKVLFMSSGRLSDTVEKEVMSFLDTYDKSFLIVVVPTIERPLPFFNTPYEKRVFRFNKNTDNSGKNAGFLEEPIPSNLREITPKIILSCITCGLTTHKVCDTCKTPFCSNDCFYNDNHIETCIN